MNVEVTGPSILFTLPILGGINVTQTLLSSAIVTVLLCCCFVWLGKGITKRPSGKQVLVEKGLLLAYLSLNPGKSTLTAVHFGGKERNDGEGN